MHNTQKSEQSLINASGESDANVGSTERVVSSLAGGALIAFGLKQRGLAGAAAAILGGGLLYRGTTGYCSVYDAAGINTNEGGGKTKSPFGRSLLSGPVRVKRAVTINKSPAELYSFWRNFENLPKFMDHLESVTAIDQTRSRWKAKAPLGTSVEWEAVVTSDVPNERLGWQSVENSEIANAGTVEFRSTTNRGTEVIVTLTYEAPGGKLGEWAAWLLGEEPSVQVSDALRKFKRLMETGSIVTTEGQPSGREPAAPKTRAAGA